MSRNDMVWVYTGKKPIKKISEWKKNSLFERVKAEIAKTTKVKAAVSRITYKSGRIYLFNLYEPAVVEGVIFAVPLIDGKYIELPYARITIYDDECRDCSLDWQRHNNQWMTLANGSLEECIQEAEVSDWFQ